MGEFFKPGDRVRIVGNKFGAYGDTLQLPATGTVEAGQWVLADGRDVAQLFDVDDIELIEPDFEWEPEWAHIPTYGEAVVVDLAIERERRQSSEQRMVSPTGGEKGAKPEVFDQVPPEIELALARHFGIGASKYDAHNWRRGYDWSLSYNALRRHLAAFWAGEDTDAETGSPHIIAVAWHAFALAYFQNHNERYGNYDDRYKEQG